jgi:Ca2+-binding RTX toxin-like protein
MAIANELSINTSATALEMANTIFGPGINVLSATFTGGTNVATGGIFTGALGTIPGISPSDSGVILSTGNVADFTNADGSTNTNQSTNRSTDTQGTVDGDTQLNQVAGQATFDGTILTADFIPDGDVITMQFVFSSEEYPEYVSQSVNDAFGVWVNGTFVPVSITVAGNIAIDEVNAARNENLYRDNTGDQFNTEMDGLTYVLSIKAPVNAGQVNSIKIGVADGGDAVYDSNLLIMADSIQTVTLAFDDRVQVVADQSRTFDILANDNATTGTLQITQINGTDVVAGQTVTLTSGQQVRLNADGTVTVFANGTLGQENFTYTVSNGTVTDVGYVTINTVSAVAKDGIVQGTSGADVINAAYAGDPDGDLIDGNDGQGVQGTTGDADLILAGAGNDQVIAGGANDIVYGGTGDDTLQGGNGNDTLQGDDGNDRLEGGEGADRLMGEAGNDTLLGGADADTLFGGAGNDTADGGTGNDYVALGEGNDSFGSWSADNAGDDTIFGEGGNDLIIGGAGNDAVSGDLGDDTLSGQMGSDTLYGGEGADAFWITDDHEGDTLFGGAGVDIVAFSHFLTASGVTVTAAGADSGSYVFNATPGGFSQGQGSYFGTEQVSMTVYDDRYDGAAGTSAVTVSGREGNDSITGGSQSDVLMGGADRDTILGGEGNDTIEGGTGDDSLRGGAGDDSLRGEEGNDTIDGDAGANVIDAGAGDDLIYVYSDHLGDTVTGGSGLDRIDFALGGGDTTGLNLTLSGAGAGSGTFGSNTFQFTQVESFDLTSANDSFDASASNEAVTVAGSGGDDRLTGGQGNDLIEGGTGADTLRGGAGADTLQGGDDADLIHGAAGDSVTGGEGGADNDTLVLNYADVQSITYGGGTNEAGTVTFTAASGGGTLTFSEIENVVLQGVVDGTAGADTMQAGYTDAQGDQIDGADGNDDTILGYGGNDIILAAAGNDVVEGGEGEDVLAGGAGNDTLSGGTEDDTLLGGAGADSMDGGPGLDIADYADSDAAVSIDIDALTATGGHAAGDSLAGIDGLFGSVHDDTLIGSDGQGLMPGNVFTTVLDGGAGNDSLDGKAGNDSLHGGVGNDTILGGLGDDLIEGDAMSSAFNPTAHMSSGLGAATSFTVQNDSDQTLTLYWIDYDGALVSHGTVGPGGGWAVGTFVGHNWVLFDDATGKPVQYLGTPADGATITYVQGSDSIDAGDGNDTVRADGGDDVVDAGADNDLVYGGTGNDTLRGGEDEDTLYGEAGRDSLLGGGEVDLIYGGDGNDTIDGGENTDTVYGGAGDDLITDTGSSLSDDSLYGGDGNDTISGGEREDLIAGDAGNDHLTGGAGADTLMGGADADVIYGGAGDSVVGGEAVTAGSDSDTLMLNFADVASLTYGGGNNEAGTVTFTAASGGGTLTFSEIERIAFTGAVDGTAGDDTMGWGYTDAQGDQIDGADGDNDTILGYGGNDSITGSMGDDLIYGGTGNDGLVGSNGNDTLMGEAGDDHLDGAGGNDQLDGGTGNDTILARDTDGVDTIAGGEGTPGDSDLLQLYSTTPGTGVTVTFSGAEAGTYAFDGGAASGSFTGIEAFSTTEEKDSVDASSSTAGQTIFSNGGADTVSGGSGDDLIGAGTGDDSVAGGQGNDTIWAGAGNDVVRGGAGADVITGDDDADTIHGGAGDTVYGGEGGADNDTLVLNYADVASITYGGGNNEAGTVTFTAASGGGTLTFAEIERIAFAGPVDGTAANDFMVAGYTDVQGDQIDGTDGEEDTVFGYDGDDWIEATAGNDTVYGGTGGDTIYGGLGNNELHGDEGNDFVWTDNSNDTLAGLQDTLYGGAGDDTLYARYGDDTIYGGTGNDIIHGGPGADIAYGEDGDDQLNGGVDGANDVFYGGNGNDDLRGDDGNDTLDGDAGNDLIAGGNNDDLALGGDGNDALFGGAGNDALRGEAGRDEVTGGEGDDLVDGGDDADSLYGGAGRDSLQGGAGNDFMEGGDGNDLMVGGANDDILFGGADADTLYAGGGDFVDGDEGVTTGEDNDTLHLTGVQSVSFNPSNAENGTVLFTDGSTLQFFNIERVFVDGTQVRPLDYIVEGGAGDDLIDAGYTGDPEGDRIDAADNQTGTDADVVTAGAGDDTVRAGLGDDSVAGEAGNDLIETGAGADTAEGGEGADTLDGGAGNDSLAGGAGDDSLRGDGAELLVNPGLEAGVTEGAIANAPLPGWQTASGTAEVWGHTYNVASPDKSNIVELDQGAAPDAIWQDVQTEAGQTYTLRIESMIRSGAEGQSFEVWFAGTRVATVTPGSSFAQDVFTVTGTGGLDRLELRELAGESDSFGPLINHVSLVAAGDDTLTGGAGNDTLVADQGRESLLGEGGDDRFVAEAFWGNDTVTGGETDEWAGDTLDLSALTRDVVLDLSAGDATSAEDGTVTEGANVLTFSEIENIFLGAGHDTVIGSTGDDTINAGFGNDSIAGGEGNDQLDGDAGRDTLAGGAGDDVVIGGMGQDSLAGGAGNDTVILGFDGDADIVRLSDGDGQDTIDGFDAPIDNGDGTFTGIDRLDVSSLTDADGNPVNVGDVVVSDDGAGSAVLTFPNGEQVTLWGIAPATADNPAWLAAIGIPGLTPDYIVEGTAGDDTIDASYTGDPEGDRVDAGDAANGSDDDVIEAGAGNDLVLAGAGNDRVIAADGNDTITGDAGDDTLAGGDGIPNNDDGSTADGDDLIYGGAGNDQLLGEAGADLLEGGEGNDNLLGGSGDDTLDGGDGNDAMNGGGQGPGATAPGNDVLYGGAGDDWMFGDATAAEAGDDRMEGGSGNDALFGGSGADTLAGDEGDDLIAGGGGDDVVVAGAGADTVTGGETEETAGDRLDASALAGDVTLDLAAGDAASGEDGTLSHAGGTTTFAEIERITLGGGNDTVLGSSGDDRVAAGAGDDSLAGGAGNDDLQGGAGNDTFTGGAGDDRIEGADGADLVIFSGVIGEYEFDYLPGGGLLVTDLVPGRDGADTIAGVDYVQFGGVVYHLVTGDDGSNTTLQGPNDGTPTLIIAHDGNDWGGGHPTSDHVIGGRGEDTLDGGDGNDTLDGGPDNDLLRGEGGNDSLIGGGGADTLQGGAGDDVAQGGLGDDTFTLADDFGNDTILGGEGAETTGDTLDLSATTAGVRLDLRLADPEAGRVLQGANTAQFGEIERIVLGGGTDTVVLADGSGADRVEGFAAPVDNGDGTFTGRDQLDVADLTDAGGEPVNTADVTVSDDGTGNAVLTFPGGERLTLVGVAPAAVSNPAALAAMGIPAAPDLTVDGTGAADSMLPGYIDAQGDIIDGADGLPDSIFGYDGDDTISAGEGNDSVRGGTGNDMLFGDAGDDTVFGDEGDDRIEGNEGRDILDGNTGNDVLYAGDGDDAATGAGGEDFVFGGAGNDTVDGGDDNDAVSGDEGDDIVSGGMGDDLLTGDAGRDTLFGAEGNDSLYGGAEDDSLAGGEGDDWLTGEAGNDTLLGDAGNDFFYADAGDDVIIGGEGNDVADGGDGNDTFDGSTGDDRAEGRAGNDSLQGGAGNDSLFGWEDNDTIDGGADDDMVDGDGGNDSLAGGEGNDTLVGDEGDDSLAGGAGRDELYGGTGKDTLDGGDGIDLIFAGDDRDTIVGTGGAVGDTVDGGSGGDDFDVLDLTFWGKDRTEVTYTSPDRQSGKVDFYDTSGNLQGTLQFSEIEKVIPCFTPGARVVTDRGEVAVEDIVPGDRVLTRDAGYQTVQWAGRRDLGAADLAARPDFAPVRIARGALGPDCPAQDMVVSPQHRMLMTGPRAELLFGEAEVLVAAVHLVGLPGVERIAPGEVSYIHLLFDRHEIIRVDATWTESFQPGRASLNGLDRAARDEVLALFPELAEGVPYPAARLTLKAHEARVLMRG